MAPKLLLPPRTPRLPLVLEPDNPDAHTLLAAVERAAPSASTILSESAMPPPSSATPSTCAANTWRACSARSRDCNTG
jgi:hypothetical protein